MDISRNLEVTVISAEELKYARRSIKKNAFVIIKSDSRNYELTKMDTDGGSYPRWNQKLQLALPSTVRLLSVEVHCKMVTGDKTIGTASIPVSDFLGSYVPVHYLHFLSYRLREWDGERNGIVNLSVRVKTPENVGRSLPLQVPYGEKNPGGGGIAVGIPVTHEYRMQH